MRLLLNMESDNLDHDPMIINIYAKHSSNMIVKSLVPVIEFIHITCTCKSGLP